VILVAEKTTKTSRKRQEKSCVGVQVEWRHIDNILLQNRGK